MSDLHLGSLFGLELSASRTAPLWAAGLWILLTVAGLFVFSLSLFAAVVGGFLGVVLHVLSEVVHQLGHAGAARNAGYPMRGIRFWTLLGASVYPADEPPLPAAVHIRRALGGPAVSLLLTVIALLIVLVAPVVGGLFLLLSLWFFVENLFVFVIGALLPLSFTDGGTIARYWTKP